MRVAPLVPPPPTDGPFVLAARCEVLSDLVMFGDLPVTGVVATVIDGSPSADFERVRLDRYVDGKLVGEFADTIAGIDTSVCVIFTDGHYASEFPSQATASLEPDAAPDTMLVGRASTQELRILRIGIDGALMALTMPVELEGTAVGSGSWAWNAAGDLTSATLTYGPDAESFCAERSRGEASFVSVQFAEAGRLECFGLIDHGGDGVPAVTPAGDPWLPADVDELFTFELAETMLMPTAPSLEARVLDAAPSWFSCVKHLEDARGDRLAFTARLVAATDLSSLTLPGFNTKLSRGGFNPIARLIDGHRQTSDDHALLQIAKDFLMAKTGRSVEIDGCLLGSIDNDPSSLLRPHLGTILFDGEFENLVALNAPFLRPIHIELMAASTKLRYVRVFRLRAEDKQSQLEETISQHPDAHFDLRTVTESDGSYEAWLQDLAAN